MHRTRVFIGKYRYKDSTEEDRYHPLLSGEVRITRATKDQAEYNQLDQVDVYSHSAGRTDYAFQVFTKDKKAGVELIRKHCHKMLKQRLFCFDIRLHAVNPFNQSPFQVVRRECLVSKTTAGVDRYTDIYTESTGFFFDNDFGSYAHKFIDNDLLLKFIYAEYYSKSHYDAHEYTDTLDFKQLSRNSDWTRLFFFADQEEQAMNIIHQAYKDWQKHHAKILVFEGGLTFEKAMVKSDYLSGNEDE